NPHRRGSVQRTARHHYARDARAGSCGGTARVSGTPDNGGTPHERGNQKGPRRRTLAMLLTLFENGGSEPGMFQPKIFSPTSIISPGKIGNGFAFLSFTIASASGLRTCFSPLTTRCTVMREGE